MAVSVRTRMIQFSGNGNRFVTTGERCAIATTANGLMQNENTKLTATASRIRNQRVSQPTPVKATTETAAAVALIAAIRHQKRPVRNIGRPRPCVIVYCGLEEAAGIGMSVSPGTFSDAGAKRPPTAIP